MNGIMEAAAKGSLHVPVLLKGSSVTVSYTHLDVYKRQDWTSSIPMDTMDCWRMDGTAILVPAFNMLLS